MADNYLEFSEVIENLTSEEIEWWEKEEKLSENAYEDDSSCHDFSVHKKNQHVWFHADENGDPDKVADIVQRFLKQFRLNERFSLTWAFWCSKPRIGEFGGGAIFITAHEIKHYNSHQWLSDRREERDVHQ